MEVPERNDELLRRLDAFASSLRPMGIRLKFTASMLRGSRRLQLAEKLFDLHAEHSIPDAFDLCFDVGCDQIIELITPLVGGGDLSDWLALVYFELYKGRVDLTSGFVRGIQDAVLVAKDSMIREVCASVRRELGGALVADQAQLTGACEEVVRQLTWHAIEILHAIYCKKLTQTHASSELGVTVEEIEKTVSATVDSIQARIRKQRPGDHREHEGGQ